MGRHDGPGGDRRGAHRAEPKNSGTLGNVGQVLGSTVPRRVEPPRLLSVLLVSGVALGLLLFAYSTTQIYLRFNEPPAEQQGAGAVPSPGEEESESPSPQETPDQQTDPGNSSQPGGEGGSPAGLATVSYEVLDSTDSAFSGQITVTNTSRGALADWELVLGFANAQVTSLRNANWESTEGGIVARHPPGTDPLAPGEAATIDFTAEGPAQTPDSCSLNGDACSL